MAMTADPVKPHRNTAFCTAFCTTFCIKICTPIFTTAFSASLICLGLAGCAGPSAGSKPHAGVPGFRDPAMSIQSAYAAIAIGTSTRAEVLMALGPAIVVKFDSGHEVWVYRDKSPEKAVTPAELVILFAPSGVVKKTRIKPQY